MIIGITEAGDASRDYTWLAKLPNCDGAILITKNVTDEFIDAVTRPDVFHKVIIHATCTGMGGTVIEPNVPPYTLQLAQVQKLIDKGFPNERIVVRIDPIVPTEKGLQTAQKVVDASPVKRFRFSLLDCYPHVRERFKAAGVPLPYGETFQPSRKMVDSMRFWLFMQELGTVFEACAEPDLTDIHCVRQVGCVSRNDLKLLGLPTDGEYSTGMQRHSCKCLSCKTELLSKKGQCPNGCLYCYWK